MSYAKMMKWNSRHRKGISYKRGYMGFNPSGITAQEYNEREQKFITEIKQKTRLEQIQYAKNIYECIKIRKGSWLWQWCTFERHFGNIKQFAQQHENKTKEIERLKKHAEEAYKEWSKEYAKRGTEHEKTMNTPLTASTDLFNPKGRIIFFFEQKIGEVTEGENGFFAESICRGKKAIFRTYNIACDFLLRCYEHQERTRAKQVIQGQLGLMF